MLKSSLLLRWSGANGDVGGEIFDGSNNVIQVFVVSVGVDVSGSEVGAVRRLVVCVVVRDLG